MKTKPILFSTPMIHALLEGRKTQTRRIVKPAPQIQRCPIDGVLEFAIPQKDGTTRRLGLKNYAELCPYGRPGDLLYVRETWRTYKTLDHLRPSQIRSGAGIEYTAGGTNVRGEETLLGMGKTRTSIHMPRWASRLTLRITDVRVQRLQEISEEDVLAEGAGAWDVNPWVWALTFEVLRQNVDQVIGEAA